MEISNREVLIYKKGKRTCFMKFIIESNNNFEDKLLNELNDKDCDFISIGSVILDKKEISYIEFKD